MPSSLPAAMFDALVARKPRHFTFDLTLPNTAGGLTTYKFAEPPVARDSGGTYSPYIQSFGGLTRDFGFPTLGFQNPRTTIIVKDVERVLQKALGGPAAGKVIGASATVTLRSPDVSEANHYVALPGVVKDAYPSGDRRYTFVIGPNVEIVNSNLKIPRPEELWDPSTLPVETRTKPGRVIWGRWVSSGRSGVGLIDCYLVDPVNGYWFYGNGHYPDGSVTGVWVDEVDDTADWTLVRILRNGHPVTVIQYTGGSGWDEGNKVQVDGTGLGDFGDGRSAETYETVPSEALRITLSNFVFGSWPVGAFMSVSEDDAFTWLSTASEIDATSFTSAGVLHGLLNHEIAAIWTSDMKGRDVISEFIDTFWLPVFWSDEFKLKVGDLMLYRRAYPTLLIRQDEHEIQQIVGRSFAEHRLSRVNVPYLLDPSRNAFDRRFTATNDDLPFFKEIDRAYTAGGPSVVP